MASKQKIAIIGAGLGGGAAAVMLQQNGYDVTVYEQAPSFSRLGAGIHLGPNVVRILDRIGIGEELHRTGSEPESWVSRMWDTSAELFTLPLKSVALERYGARYLTVHRGDFHALLIAAINADSIHYDKNLTGLSQDGDGVALGFADGTSATADIVIGADGLNSMVREAILGPEKPAFTGVVGHRAMFPASAMKGGLIDDVTKWWTDERHFISYYITSSHDEIYIVTGVPHPEWTSERSWLPCPKDEFRAAFDGFDAEVQRLIDHCPDDGITKWAFYERKPLPLWSEGRIVLLGDACHPMKPHMGQGAAMAIEDAAMLMRCMEETGLDDYRAAFALYEANRKDRASLVQSTSHSNEWLRVDTDPTWVFGYDVYSEPLKMPDGTATN